MKIFLLLFVIIQFLFSAIVSETYVNLSGFQKQQTRISDTDWVKSVTQKYSPHSWDLLTSYEKLPHKQEARLTDNFIISVQKPVKTFHYLKGSTKTELLLSMSTNVHEISHAYFRNNSLKIAVEKGIRLNWDNVEGTFYLSPSNYLFISVPRKILFPSAKLAMVIPSNARTFRFDTYIKGNTSTQDEGVIGLLNEFHAYYTGSKFTFEMLEAYQISEGKARGFHYWLSHLNSTMTAYYEFDYFIKEYLLFMKEKYPADYESLKTNNSFVKAYKTVFDLYSRLIENYNKKVDEQIKSLTESKTAEIVFEEDILWVTPAGSKYRMGTSVFSEDKAKIEGHLNSSRYSSVEYDFF